MKPQQRETLNKVFDILGEELPPHQKNLSPEGKKEIENTVLHMLDDMDSRQWQVLDLPITRAITVLCSDFPEHSNIAYPDSATSLLRRTSVQNAFADYALQQSNQESLLVMPWQNTISPYGRSLIEFLGGGLEALPVTDMIIHNMGMTTDHVVYGTSRDAPYRNGLPDPVKLTFKGSAVSGTRSLHGRPDGESISEFIRQYLDDTKTH